jgi:hypothetical protein
MKDLREWGNFAMTFIIFLAIPLCYSILRSQRLEIEKEMSEAYVSRSSYQEDKSRAEQERRDTLQSIGSIQGKLDSVFLEQVHINDSMAIMKERSK